MLDDDVVAVHEAGHMFVAAALGLAVWRVQLDSPRYDLVDRLSPDRRLDHIRVLMAGGEGKRVVFDSEPIGTGSDDPRIEQLLQDGDDEDALRAQVRDLLAANSGNVRWLAAKLRRHGMLDGS